MKLGAGHTKGAAFERGICRQLSLWWTFGTRDDIFWRTPQSGGRATRREQKGKGSAGHYGDIMAVDPIGNPLLQFMTFELKHGYRLASAMDLVDGGKKSQWGKWILGAKRVHLEANSLHFALIVRRHMKKVVICFSSSLRQSLGLFSCPHLYFYHPDYGSCDVVLFEDFLDTVTPEKVTSLVSGWEGGN